MPTHFSSTYSVLMRSGRGVQQRVRRASVRSRDAPPRVLAEICVKALRMVSGGKERRVASLLSQAQLSHPALQETLSFLADCNVASDTTWIKSAPRTTKSSTAQRCRSCARRPIARGFAGGRTHTAFADVGSRCVFRTLRAARSYALGRMLAAPPWQRTDSRCSRRVRRTLGHRGPFRVLCLMRAPSHKMGVGPRDVARSSSGRPRQCFRARWALL